jgi:hypothetical protein
MEVDETLMVGTHGWDHDEWAGSYYPEELPDDWRFGYYSNEYRAVLMSANHWYLEQPIEDWIEDADKAFRMVLELPSDLSRPLPKWREKWEQFRRDSELLDPFRRGYVLTTDPAAETDAEWLRQVLRTLGELAPVSVDLAGPWRTGALSECVYSNGGTVLWYCDESDMDEPPGDGLWVAIAGGADARRQREVIEKLGAWMEQNGGAAGLFFEGSRAPEAAAGARIIAEMLGI